MWAATRCDLAISLVLLMLSISAMNVVNSYVGRDFMTSIEQRERGRFFGPHGVLRGVFAGSTLLTVYFRFCEERLGLLWRSGSTRQRHRARLSGIATRTACASRRDRQPDQRIADDVRSFTTTRSRSC
jgi:putative ATP-binding cassette transporter